MHRAVFVDRDGVICHNRKDHVKSWGEFVFLPGSLDALRRLADLDLPIVVITNQAAINRGIVAAEMVEDINARMVQAIETAGGRVDRVVYCPHRPNEGCACRKPQPGMLLRAAQDMGIDLSQSYMVGDAETDVQAGRTVGCRCYLVLTGRGRRQFVRALIRGDLDFMLKWNLGSAVSAILRHEREAKGRYSCYVLGGGNG